MAISSLTMTFIVLFFMSTSIPSIVEAQLQGEMIARICRAALEQDLSIYSKNFLVGLSSLQDQVENDAFGAAVQGLGPNRVFLLAQCMGDVSQGDCRTCFSDIKRFIAGCFPSIGGRVYMDGCFIRGENYSFFHEAVTKDDTKACGKFPSNGGSDVEKARSLVDGLIRKAPKNKGFSKGYLNSTAGTVFGVANCWKTLDAFACRTCLENAGAKALSCLPAKEGRGLNAGCIVRYSDVEVFPDDPGILGDRYIISALILTIIFTTATSAAAITLGVFVGKLVYNRVHNQNGLKGLDVESSLLKGSLHFKYSTLEKATCFFSKTNKLGQGGSGEVYKGTLADGREVAVKRLFGNAKSHGMEISNEMNVMSRAQHKNLVRFLGCSLNGTECFLIYEYVANKSLDWTLFHPERKKELDWKKRKGIITGIAEGLEYLHKDCKVKIVHRDIKPSNILLDERFRPKIGDFGLARLFLGRGGLKNTIVAGTLGYMAPEYLSRGQLTEKADVYSFGVLILEVISGVQINKFTTEKSAMDTLVTAAWRYFKSDTLTKIVDKSLQLDETEVGEVLRGAKVGLLCTQEVPSLRPSMTEVIRMLRQNELPIPKPTKPPFVDEAMESSHMSHCPPLPLQSAHSNSHHHSETRPR